MSVLACNLQTAALNDQQELRKAAFKLVYGWIVSPALWAQSLTHKFWFQVLYKLWGRQDTDYFPDYQWVRRSGCDEPYLATANGGARNCTLDNTTYMHTYLSSISSKSSVATLALGGQFPPGVFLQPDAKRLKLTSQ